MIQALVPSAADQLTFLDYIQRVFEEGEFVATYKFALLLAITELAVEYGDDSSAELDLPFELIAEKFLEMYWPHAAPYSGGTETGILSQSSGRQAAVVNLIQDIREKFSTISRARTSVEWSGAIKKTIALLKEMPLWRLQVLRRQHVEFLYAASPNGHAIRLKPSVSHNLRRFHGIIQHFAKSAWLTHIRSNPKNAAIIGQAAGLEDVMFGVDRSALVSARPVLREIQLDTCFYCKQPLRSNGEVDHFIPWSRYPRDLGHNFVLAHKSCNLDKCDLLAATTHLASWRNRNVVHSKMLAGELGRKFICDEPTMLKVARWAYGQAFATAAQSWLSRKIFVPLAADYREILKD